MLKISRNKLRGVCCDSRLKSQKITDQAIFYLANSIEPKAHRRPYIVVFVLQNDANSTSTTPRQHCGDTFRIMRLEQTPQHFRAGLPKSSLRPAITITDTGAGRRRARLGHYAHPGGKAGRSRRFAEAGNRAGVRRPERRWDQSRRCRRG